MKKLILAIILQLSFSVSVHAYQRRKMLFWKLNNSRIQIKSASLDSVQIRMMIQLSSEFMVNHEVDSAKKYASIALKNSDIFLAKSDASNDVQRYLKLKAESLLNIGNALIYENTNLASDTLNMSLKFWEETGDKIGIANVHESIAEVYTLQSDYKKAIIHLNESKRYFEELDRLDKVAEHYYKKGLVKRYMGNYGDALEDNLFALKKAKELKDTSLITDALLANAFSYMFVKKFPKRLKTSKKL